MQTNNLIKQLIRGDQRKPVEVHAVFTDDARESLYDAIVGEMAREYQLSGEHNLLEALRMVMDRGLSFEIYEVVQLVDHTEIIVRK